MPLGGSAPRPEFWSISRRTSYPAPLASGSFWQDMPIFEVPPLRPRMVWGWRCRGRELSTRPGLWAEPLRGFPAQTPGPPRTGLCDATNGPARPLVPTSPVATSRWGGGSPGRGPAPLCPLLPGQCCTPVSPADPPARHQVRRAARGAGGLAQRRGLWQGGRLALRPGARRINTWAVDSGGLGGPPGAVPAVGRSQESAAVTPEAQRPQQ